MNFNQPLGDSLQGLSSVTHLTLGDYFNQFIGDCFQGLSNLTFLKMNEFLYDRNTLLNITSTIGRKVKDGSSSSTGFGSGKIL